MLADKNVAATVAVKDIEVARRFYGETLGLTEVENEEAMNNIALYRSGSSMLLLYVSEHAGTNAATSATWSAVEDIDSVVEALKAKGVRFEHYDFPDTKREGDVHVFGDIRNAWFRDPDGNILSLVNR